MGNLENTNVERRFVEDIEKMDAIITQVADIIYRLELKLMNGNFDIDAFAAQIESDFELDETRKLLFGRAVEKYKRAIEFTQQNQGDMSSFLRQTKLNLDKYDGIEAGVDPTRPGVVVIKLKSQKDALQFHNDTKPGIQSAIEGMFAELGVVGRIIEQDPNNYAGRSVALESLGIGEGVPILGTIVLCQFHEDEARRELVKQHEYAHALYSSLVLPFVHRYFSALDKDSAVTSRERLNVFSEETKQKMLAALGNISTCELESAVKRRDAPPSTRKSTIDFGDDFMIPGVHVITPQEHVDDEIGSSLYHERLLLDDLRSYGFSDPLISPKQQTTKLEMRARERESELGVIDPQMAQRYLEVHLKILSLYFHHPGLHLKGLCILAASQSLSQANRLLQELMDKYKDVAMNDKERFAMLLRISAGIVNKNERLLTAIEYKIGAAEIPFAKVVASLLPDRAVFDKAVQDFCDGEKSEEVLAAEALYGLS